VLPCGLLAALQDISLNLTADMEVLQQRMKDHISDIQPRECPSNERIAVGTTVSQ